MMRSPPDSLRQTMPADYRQYVGLAYEPPHGCLRLVEQVVREQYGRDFRDVDSDVEPNDDRALYRLLKAHCDPVEHEREGDLIVIRSTPWHIGLVIGDGQMLHSYSGGAACVEPYRGPMHRNRISGFWRLK